MLCKELYSILYFYSFLLIVYSKSDGRKQISENSLKSTEELKGDGTPENLKLCWITINSEKYFPIMDNLQETYAHAIRQYAENSAFAGETFDKQTLAAILASRGKLESNNIKLDEIPAGLNLGGNCMMRMKESLLFFHRMKLRNSTIFKIKRMRTDLANMTITAELDLHDLHLMGSYERLLTSKYDPSVLVYTPTFGQTEFLLKSVKYKFEGRLRFINDSLNLAMVISQIDCDEALLKYKNRLEETEKPISIPIYSLFDFIERMKNDLDMWLKDYFNHYLIFFFEAKAATDKAYREYDKKKTVALNNYADEALDYLRTRIKHYNASSVMLPKFSINADNLMTLKLTDGNLTGLHTIYRRSVATTVKEGILHKVDFDVGFSNLKAIYKYVINWKRNRPPMTGVLIMSAEEAVAHAQLILMEVDRHASVNIDFLQQLKPESLIIEGPANREIANFRHILEHHIFSLMSNVIVYKIRKLSTLSRCYPDLLGNDDEEESREERPAVTESEPDYEIKKEDSVELVMPPDETGAKKTIHMKFKESVALRPRSKNK